MENKRQLVEIWGDVVELKSLLISIILSGLFTMGAYFLAPSNDKTMQLFYGLAGSVVGFIFSSIVIKPKRIITIKDD